MNIQRLNERLLGIMLPLSFGVVVLSFAHFLISTSPVHGLVIISSYVVYNIVKSLAHKTIMRKQTEAALQLLKQYQQTSGENK